LAVKTCRSGGEPVAQQGAFGKRKLQHLVHSATLFHPCLEALSAYPQLMGLSCESSADFLQQQPGMQRVPIPSIELFQHKEFLDHEHCSELINLIDANRRPSTIADDNGDRYFRTSETCDLEPSEPAVEKTEKLLSRLSGIDPAFGEPLQGQRYAEGQEFKPHTDYFTPDGDDFERFCAIAGQRTWTFMIYLNEVEAGGATRFRMIGKTYRPECGKLLCWNNRQSDGSVNPNTLHHGMKVRRGVKYVITKWYREREWGW
jgi:prolyl 4-hydroxylase